MSSPPTPATAPTATDAPASAPSAPQTPDASKGKAKGHPKGYGPSASVLARALASGEAKVYRQRKTGTLRLLPFYAKGSDARARAEAVTKAVKASSVRQVAEDTGTSVPTVRRLMTNLALTLAIEGKELDGLYDGTADKIVLPPNVAGEDEQ